MNKDIKENQYIAIDWDDYNSISGGVYDADSIKDALYWLVKHDEGPRLKKRQAKKFLTILLEDDLGWSSKHYKKLNYDITASIRECIS